MSMMVRTTLAVLDLGSASKNDPEFFSSVITSLKRLACACSLANLIPPTRQKGHNFHEKGRWTPPCRADEGVSFDQ